MNNFTPFNQNQTFQPYQQVTQYFPQPQGNIYMINNATDIANVPAGVGLSAAIYPRDNILYLKTIQNGNPMLLAYRLTPLESGDSQSPIQEQSSQQTQDKKIAEALEDFDKRLQSIEKQLYQKGGNVEWPKL